MTGDQKPSACDRVLAHYHQRVGAAWRPADDVLFRAAWAEGAHERDRQLREYVDATRDLLVRCTRELAALSCPLTDLFEAIDRHLSETP